MWVACMIMTHRSSFRKQYACTIGKQHGSFSRHDPASIRHICRSFPATVMSANIVAFLPKWRSDDRLIDLGRSFDFHRAFPPKNFSANSPFKCSCSSTAAGSETRARMSFPYIIFAYLSLSLSLFLFPSLLNGGSNRHDSKEAKRQCF